jgi:hypothetical protein
VFQIKDTVKEIRVDGAKELFIMCKEYGINLKPTEPYQHEYNGKIKRIHSIIDSMVRPWLYNAGLHFCMDDCNLLLFLS